MSDTGSYGSGTGGGGTGGYGGGGGTGGFGMGNALPEPPSRDYDIERRLALLPPELGADPEAAMALAMSGLDDQAMIEGALGTVDQAVWEQQAIGLSDEEEAYQRAYWTSLDPGRQKLLSDAGYVPPEMPDGPVPHEEPKKDNWWQRNVTNVTEDIDDALLAGGSALFHGLTVAGDTIAGRPGRTKEALEADQQFANYQLLVSNAIAEMRKNGTEVSDEEAQQLAYEYWSRRGTNFKTTEMIDFSALDADTGLAGALDEDPLNQTFGMPVDDPGVQISDELWNEFDTQRDKLEGTDRFNPSARAAWGRVATGSDWFRPTTQVEALDALDGDWARFELAYEVARGTSVTEILESYGLTPESPEFIDAYTETQQVLSLESMQKAINTMSQGTYSVGQGFAEANGLAPGTAGYNVMSGMADATMVLTLDPTLFAGKVNAGRRTVMYGIPVVRSGQGLLSHGDQVVDALVNAEDLARAAKGSNRLITFADEDAWRTVANLSSDTRKLVPEALVAGDGRATQFLTDNYDEVVSALQRDARVQRAMSRMGPAEKRAEAFQMAEELEDAHRVLTDQMLTNVAESTAVSRAGRLRHAKLAGARRQYDALDRVSRAFKEAADGGPENLAFEQLTRDMPQMVRALPSLFEYDAMLRSNIGRGIESVDDIYAYLRDAQTGMRAMASGHFGTAITSSALEIPYRTRIGALGNRAMQRSETFLNKMADVRVHDEASKLARAMGLVPEMVGRTALAVTHRMPQQGILNLADWEEFQRFVQVGMHSGIDYASRRQYMERFIRGAAEAEASGSLGNQVLVARDFLSELFERSGTYDNPKLAEWARNVTAAAGSEWKLYSPDGIDLVTRGGNKFHAPVLIDAQRSNRIMVPLFNDFISAKGRVTKMHAVWGSINNSTVSAFMGNVWAPAMVMKLGFIPRAVGEEALAWVARIGMRDSAETWIANTITSGTYSSLTAPINWAGNSAARIQRRVGRRIPSIAPDVAAQVPHQAYSFMEMAKYQRLRDWMEQQLLESGILAEGHGLKNAREVFDHIGKLDGMRFYANWWAGELTKKSRLFRARAHLVDPALIAASGQTSMWAMQSYFKGEAATNATTMLWGELATEVYDQTSRRMMRHPVVQQAFAEAVDGRHLSSHGDLFERQEGSALRISRGRRRERDYVAEYLDTATDGTWAQIETGGKLPEFFARKIAMEYAQRGDDLFANAGVNALIGYIGTDQAIDIAHHLRMAPPLTESGVEALSVTADDVIAKLEDLRRQVRELDSADRGALRDLIEGHGARRYEGEEFGIDIATAEAMLPRELATRLRSAATGSAEEGLLFSAAEMATIDMGVQAQLLQDVLRLPDGYAHLLFTDHELYTGTVDDALQRAQNAVRGQFRTQQGYQAFRDSDRSRALTDSTPVLRPPTEHTRSYYGVTVSQETVDQIALALREEGGAEALLAALNRHLDDRGRRVLGQLIAEWDTPGQSALVDWSRANGQMQVPLGRLASQDDQLMSQLADAFGAMEEAAKRPRTATLAATRVVDTHRMSPAVAAHVARKVDGFEGELFRMGLETQRQMRPLLGRVRRVDVGGGLSEEAMRAALRGSGKTYDDELLARAIAVLGDDDPSIALLREPPLPSGQVDEGLRSVTGTNNPIRFPGLDDMHERAEAAELTLDEYIVRYIEEHGYTTDQARAIARTGLDPDEPLSMHWAHGDDDVVIRRPGEFAFDHMSATFARRQQEAEDEVIAALMREQTDRDSLGAHLIEGATETEAMDDAARKVVEDLKAHFIVNDEVLHDLAVPLADGRLGLDTLERISPNRLPRSLVVPEVHALKHNKLRRAIDYGWEHVIGGPMSALIRRPMFTHKLAQALDAAEPVAALLRHKPLYNDGLRALRAVGTKKTDLEDVRELWSAIPRHERERLTGAGLHARFDFMAEGHFDEFLMHEDEWDTLAAFLRHDGWVEDQLMTIASDRAVADLVPFLDDNRVRSYFSGFARNLMPFWFAQEQFYKRWVRTLAHSPEGLRRAQLIAHGFTQGTWVDENERGEKVIVIPLSESASQMFSSSLPFRMLFGTEAAIPMAVPLTMQVDHMLPGVGAGIKEPPSLGPLATIPLGAAASRFEWFQPYADNMMGERGANRAVAEQLIPSWALRVIGGSTGIDEARLTGATIGAMQMMEAEASKLRDEAAEERAAGNVDKARELDLQAEELEVPDLQVPGKMQAYIDNVNRWARTMVTVQGVFGFFSPGGSTIDFPGDEVAADLQEMLAIMPPDEAMAAWLARNPHANAFAVFPTTNEAKGTAVPPSQESLEWMQTNREWMEAFPTAAPWLMPQLGDNEPFSQRAWAEQVAMGLRSYKSPEEWVNAYHFASAAPAYFDMQEAHAVDLARAGDNAQARGILEAEYQRRVEAYKMMHPAFAAQLTGENRTRREDTIDQIELALGDPGRPPVAQDETYLEMIGMYRQFQGAIDQLAGDQSDRASDIRKAVRSRFSMWGEQFIVDHPEAHNLWRSLIEQAADLRDDRVTRELLAEDYGSSVLAEEAMMEQSIYGN